MLQITDTAACFSSSIVLLAPVVPLNSLRSRTVVVEAFMCGFLNLFFKNT